MKDLLFYLALFLFVISSLIACFFAAYIDLSPETPTLKTEQEQINDLREDHNNLAEFTYRELEKLHSELKAEAHKRENP